MSALHCETQATWKNLFFTVPIIKLRMFGCYISVAEHPWNSKPRLSVFVLYCLISQINNVWKFILIRYGNSF